MTRTAKAMCAGLAATFCAIGLTACGASASNPEEAAEKDPYHHEMQILVQMRVCQPAHQDPTTDFDEGPHAPENCNSVPIPQAKVTISSQGRELWSGLSDNFGRVQVEFTTQHKWTIRARSGLLVSDIVSPGNPVDPTLQGMNVESHELYGLTVLKE